MTILPSKTDKGWKVVIDPTKPRPDWDDWALGIVEAIRQRADCRRAKHGCLILDTEHRLVSAGYNGSPRGDRRSCLAGDCPRGLKDFTEVPHNRSDYSDCISLHAEVNAVANGDASRMRGGTAYVSGEPCDMCWKVLKASGVRRVVYVARVGNILQRLL